MKGAPKRPVIVPVVVVATMVAGLLTLFPQVALSNGEISDGTYDTTFLSGKGVNQAINRSVIVADGKILLLGATFTEYDGVPSGRITRVFPDGSRDSTFDVGAGLNNQAFDAVNVSSGSVLVGGAFSQYNSQSTSGGLVQIKPDGSRDTGFQSPKPNGAVRSLALLSGGDVVAGGDFTAPNTRLMKFSATGILDTDFGGKFDGVEASKGLDKVVHAVATQPDGKILVGGDFTTFQGTILDSGLIRLNADGTRDTQFSDKLGTALGTGFNRVLSIRVQTDGKILVGGNFTGGLKRLNSDGTLDAAFNLNLGTGFNAGAPLVFTISFAESGHIYVGGGFTTFNGSAAVRVVRLNSDGTLDDSFTTGTGPTGLVVGVHPLQGGDVIITGSFTAYDGRLATSANPQPNRIARLTTMSLGPATQNYPLSPGEALTSETLVAVANSTVTYGVSPALPDGFTLDTSTGVVTGQSSEPLSATNYTITGTDAAGRTRSVTITLGSPPASPSLAATGPSSGSSAAAAPTPVVPAPAVTPRPSRLAFGPPDTSPVRQPVQRPGLRFDPDVPSRGTIGGVATNVSKTPVGTSGVAVVAGAFQFGVSLDGAQGAAVHTDTPSRSPEMFVPRGQSAAVSGSGSYPGSFVQLWLPNGTTSRELARIPVRSDGTFTSDVSFAAGSLEMPVPIGRQVLQVVGYDERGNQIVVDMTINIGQGAPAPEPNRQVGELPALAAGQSLGTSGGIPEAVSVTGLPDSGRVVMEGSGWVVSVSADQDSGVVENADGTVLVRLQQSSIRTTSGGGFLPGTLATVWLFSEPTLMATVTVDENGEFSAEFLVDSRLIAPGEHTLQIQGVGTDGYIKAANLGVLVEQTVELTTESASGLLWWVLGFFVLALLLMFFVLLARRRRRQDA